MQRLGQMSFINGYMSDSQVNKPYIEITYTINEGAPVTGFAANQTSGKTPLSVKFTDSSTNIPTNWDWFSVTVQNSRTCRIPKSRYRLARIRLTCIPRIQTVATGRTRQIILP